MAAILGSERWQDIPIFTKIFYMKLCVACFLLSIMILSSFSYCKTSSIVIAKSYECGDVPDLNKGIIQYVKEHLHKKVARGECWDLAAEPLNKLGANWDKMYGFGKKVDIRRDCIYPGDIIQFEGVIVKIVTGNQTVTAMMEHHTAIIYEVKDKNNFVLAHQNTGDFGRTVGLSNLNVKDITHGTFTIYEPLKN